MKTKLLTNTTSKMYCSIVLLLVSFLLSVDWAHAQPGALDYSFDPGTGVDNRVYALALQPDGKVIMVGSFTSYNGVDCNPIVRLNVDGSLDNTFNPAEGDNWIVSELVLQPDGKIVIGGSFKCCDTQRYNPIARLNADGSLDNSFSPSLGADRNIFIVDIIAVQTDGKVIIKGKSVDPKKGIYSDLFARLNADGSLDNNFNPPRIGDYDDINVVALQPDGKVIIGGEFHQYIGNGASWNRIARLNPNGSLDNTFNSGEQTSGSINALALQPDGKMIIGGDFNDYNYTRYHLARLNADGSLDNSFIPPYRDVPYNIDALVLGSEGNIYVGGESCYNYIPPYLCGNPPIVRMNTNGSLDRTFWGRTFAIAGTVYALALQPDGKVLIGGEFSKYNEISRNRIARILGKECPTLTLSPAALPKGTVSSPYNVTFSAAGSTPPYNYTVSSGNLPQGLSLSADGVLSGTLTVADSASFTLKASDVNGCSREASQTLTIEKASQTITFPSIADKTFGAPLSLKATASSGLPVVYTVAGKTTNLISIVGNVVTFLKTGVATIVASQAGNDNYNPATPDSVSFTILSRSIQNLLFTSVCSNEPAQQRKWRVRNDNSFAVTYTWEVYSYQQTGTGIAEPGDNFFFTTTVQGANTTKLYWKDENGLQKEVVKASSGEGCTLTNLIFTSMCSDYPSISRRWRIRNPNTVSLSVDWEVYGTTQTATVVAPPGDSFFSTQTVVNSSNTTKIYWRNEKGDRKSLTKASGGAPCLASARIASDEGKVEEQSGNLSVHPNPGSKQITITYSSDHEIAMPVQIISATGVVQFENYHQLLKGVNVLTEDVSKLSAGFYVIKVGLETTRFVKE